MIKLYKKAEHNIGRGVLIRNNLRGYPVKVWIDSIRNTLNKDGWKTTVMVTTNAKKKWILEKSLDKVWPNYHEFIRDEVKRLENSMEELQRKVEEMEGMQRPNLYSPGAWEECKQYKKEELDKVVKRLEGWRKLLEKADRVQNRRRIKRDNKRTNEFLRKVGIMK